MAKDSLRILYEGLNRLPISDRTWQRVKAVILYSQPSLTAGNLTKYLDFKNCQPTLPEVPKGVKFFLFYHWFNDGQLIDKNLTEVLWDLRHYSDPETVKALIGDYLKPPYKMIDLWPVYQQVLKDYRASLGLENETN